MILAQTNKGSERKEVFILSLTLFSLHYSSSSHSPPPSQFSLHLCTNLHGDEHVHRSFTLRTLSPSQAESEIGIVFHFPFHPPSRFQAFNYNCYSALCFTLLSVMNWWLIASWIPPIVCLFVTFSLLLLFLRANFIWILNSVFHFCRGSYLEIMFCDVQHVNTEYVSLFKICYYFYI